MIDWHSTRWLLSLTCGLGNELCFDKFHVRCESRCEYVFSNPMLPTDIPKASLHDPLDSFHHLVTY